jgi:hypothetical protein
MIDGQFAGWPTGWIRPTRRSLSLPAAAMISVPALSARRAAVSKMREYAWPSCVAAPNDIEMIWHPLLIAHWIPARMPESEPLPALLKTLPA